MKELFTLQLAKKRNLKAIAKIYSEEYSKQPYNEPWDKKLALFKLKKSFNYSDIYIIEKEKETIGFIIINTNFWFPFEDFFIEDFAINDKYQKKGIEEKIINQVMKIYKNKGYKNCLTIAKRKSDIYKTLQSEKLMESTDDVLLGRHLKDL
jgi:ribosomal protein S18 acetylase RimI-like enzyme